MRIMYTIIKIMDSIQPWVYRKCNKLVCNTYAKFYTFVQGKIRANNPDRGHIMIR